MLDAFDVMKINAAKNLINTGDKQGAFVILSELLAKEPDNIAVKEMITGLLETQNPTKTRAKEQPYLPVIKARLVFAVAAILIVITAVGYLIISNIMSGTEIGHLFSPTRPDDAYIVFDFTKLGEYKLKKGDLIKFQQVIAAKDIDNSVATDPIINLHFGQQQISIHFPYVGTAPVAGGHWLYGEVASDTGIPLLWHNVKIKVERIN